MYVEEYMKLQDIHKNLNNISQRNNIEDIEKAIQKNVKNNINYYYNKDYAKIFIKKY